MRREVFIKKMLQLGEELSKSNQPVTISMIINDAEKICDKYESEFKDLRVADVSKQREQLKAFKTYYDNRTDQSEWIAQHIIDDFIKSIQM